MEAAMLLVAMSVKLIAEIALMALIGRFLLRLMAGDRRDRNFFYALLGVLTNPFVKGTRAITPRVVMDRHVPLVAMLLLTMAWLAAALIKIDICLQIGVEACR
jgi:YGGT family